MKYPTGSRFIVLLSGGMDSVAAVHFAKEQAALYDGTVAACAIDYAQPHRDAELWAAGTISARRGIPLTTLRIIEARRLNPESGCDERGISRAFVPGRNAMFLVWIASEYARPGASLVLVCGANALDAAGFPDCRPAFFQHAEQMLRAAFAGLCDVAVSTPWLGATKSGILRWAQSRPEALSDIRDSVSCYRGTRCGACDACALRARAFSEVGIEDGTTLPTYCGGDPHRDAALRAGVTR